MKTFFTIFVAILVFAPCLLICNESESIIPNLVGFIYIVVLFTIRNTKVAKMALRKLEKANREIERILGFKSDQSL